MELLLGRSLKPRDLRKSSISHTLTGKIAAARPFMPKPTSILGLSRVVRVYSQSNLQQKIGMDIVVDTNGMAHVENLSPGTPYWLQAAFYDRAGNHSGSNTIKVSILPQPSSLRPAAPNKLRTVS